MRLPLTLTRIARRLPGLREIAIARDDALRAPQQWRPGHHSPLIEDLQQEDGRLFRAPPGDPA
jgi:hypothetical protein